MIERIRRWWRSYQFRQALQLGNYRHADKLLREIQASGAQLSWLEKLYRDRRKLEQQLRENKQELSSLRRKLIIPQFPVEFDRLDYPHPTLIPDSHFIKYITKSIQMMEWDRDLIQCTGTDSRTFDDFEAALANFLQEEYHRLSCRNNFEQLLQEAIDDLNQLKKGQDPEYRFPLSAHVYLTRYFLENVYCSYLAWFFIYKSQLLPTQINILDIAAGPGTVAYGLGLLLQSSSHFFVKPPRHISYYSLELQKDLQYRGLQFWRKYMENKDINAYFRFNTASFFDYSHQETKIPQQFFDFITISHCFFSNHEMRDKANMIYQEIFKNSLKPEGYVLLTIQDKKLWRYYNLPTSSDRLEEFSIISQFVQALGLKLVWYKYLTSTNPKTPLSAREFAKFAQENLYPQKSMNSLLRKYLKLSFDANYTIDDYVILAQTMRKK